MLTTDTDEMIGKDDPDHYCKLPLGTNVLVAEHHHNKRASFALQLGFPKASAGASRGLPCESDAVLKDSAVASACFILFHPVP